MADAELLAALKPARWPEAAPVVAADDLWLAVALGLAAGLVLALFLALLRRRAPGARAAALARIEAAAGLPAGDRLAATAAALRDYAARTGAPDLATARGAALAAGLDRLFRTAFFGSGDGRLFADGLYAPVDERAAEAAVDGAADLLRGRRR